MPLNQGIESNFRATKVYCARIELLGAALVGYYATDCVVARTGVGTYTIKLPQKFKRLLGADLTNAGSTGEVTDLNLATTGIVNLAGVAEPAGGVPKNIFVKLIVPTDDFNARRAVP